MSDETTGHNTELATVTVKVGEQSFMYEVIRQSDGIVQLIRYVNGDHPQEIDTSHAARFLSDDKVIMHELAMIGSLIHGHFTSTFTNNPEHVFEVLNMPLSAKGVD